MKKQVLASAILALGLCFGTYAVSVNEAELKSTGNDTIVFENYTGPHAVIETVEAIKAIGTGLGNELNSRIETAGTINPNGKYSVIHAIDPNEPGKLDADILVINSNATVDHIRNLRRIIAAYLEAAYGYSEKDAMTVATFATVYNAVYRKNLDNFKAKYKKIVVDNLTESKCGLSLKWNEWPGNSQIVIPLGEFSDGGLSSVDTSVISDKKVIESMQEEDDKQIDERKNMVDIKEREAETANEKAQEAAQEAAQEKKKLDEQKQVQKEAEKTAAQTQKQAEQAKKEADTKKAEAVKKQQEAKADPKNTKKQEEAKTAKAEADKAVKKAEEKKQEAEQAKETAKTEAAKTEEQKQKADEAAEKATEEQAKADKKQTEAQNERTEIAKDQEELIKDAIKEASDGTVIGLKITDEAKMLSSMVKINSKSGNVSKESPVTVIRGRTIIPIQDAITSIATGAAFPTSSSDTSLAYLAICGKDKKATKLCLLDAFKMEIQKESDEVVAMDSVLVNAGNNYYCVIMDNSKYVIGRYDKTVSLLMKSTVSVKPSTPITVTGSGIIVTNEKGIPVLLSLADLSQIMEISNGK